MSEMHESAGCYVVDALDPVERAAFEAHLLDCEPCRLEVVELREVTADLSGLMARPAPVALRRSVLAAVRAIQEDVPEHAVRLQNTGARPAAAGTSLLTGSDGNPPLDADLVAPLDEHPSVVPDWTWSVPVDDSKVDTEARRVRRSLQVLKVVVAAVLALAVALGGWVYSLSERNQQQVASIQAETELLSAPDAKIYRSAINGASVTYVVSVQRDEVLFLATNLADPGENAVYQLWTRKGDAATSAGLVSEGGDVRQWLRGSVRGATGLAVTHEDSPTGSKTPTAPLLFSVTL
jgi:hypothetical protein